MVKITHSDVYIRDESGPEWFRDFIRSFSKDKCSTTQDILGVINNKKSEAVSDVVDNYKELTGFNQLLKDKDGNGIISKASSKPLSIRHAAIEQNVVDVIKSDYNLSAAVDSFCEHTGGNKKIHSIINFLRDKLGPELISHNNQDLVDYINSRKDFFKDDITNECEDVDKNIGMVGKNNTNCNYDDDIADYITHGTPHK